MIRFLLMFFFALSPLCGGYEFGAKNVESTKTKKVDQAKNRGKIKTEPKTKLPFDLKDSAVVVDPPITEVRSEKGLTAWLVEQTDLDVVSFAVMVADAGVKADPQKRQGLVRFFLAMVDEGAGTYSAEQFKRFLLEHNITLSGDLGDDTFVLNFRCPRTSIDQAFEAMRLIFTQLRLDGKAVKKVKQHLHVMYQQSTQNEGMGARELMRGLLYGEHPYYQKLDDVITHLPVLNQDDLRSYIKTHLTQDKLIMAACGNISPEVLRQKLDEVFGDLPAKSLSISCGDVVFKSPNEVNHKNMAIPQSTILFTHPGIKRKDEHFYALDLALNIFGSGEFGSRLMHILREERGLVYGIGVTLEIDKHAQLIVGQASTRHKTVSEVINLVKEAWSSLVKNGVTEEELKLAKMRILGVFPLRFTNTAAITGVLLSMQYHDLGIDFLKKRTKLIQNITVDDVNKAIRELLSLDQLKFFVVGQSHESQYNLEPLSNEAIAPPQEAAA